LPASPAIVVDRIFATAALAWRRGFFCGRREFRDKPSKAQRLGRAAWNFPDRLSR
jgi:hypothetical protein